MARSGMIKRKDPILSGPACTQVSLHPERGGLCID